MTIFHVLKYPLSDTWDPNVGVRGVMEVKQEFPELFGEWERSSWSSWTDDYHLYKGADISTPVGQLRKLLYNLK